VLVLGTAQLAALKSAIPMKQKHLRLLHIWDVQGSCIADFFEAAVFGLDTEDQYQHDFDD